MVAGSELHGGASVFPQLIRQQFMRDSMILLPGYKETRLRRLAELRGVDEESYRAALRMILDADRGEIPFQIMLHEMGRFRAALRRAEEESTSAFYGHPTPGAGASPSCGGQAAGSGV